MYSNKKTKHIHMFVLDKCINNMLDTLSLKMSQTKCAFTQFLYSNIYF